MHPATTPRGPGTLNTKNEPKQAPTRNCPSAPILKSPALRARNTAAPRMRSGAASRKLPESALVAPSDPVMSWLRAAGIDFPVSRSEPRMTSNATVISSGTWNLVSTFFIGSPCSHSLLSHSPLGDRFRSGLADLALLERRCTLQRFHHRSREVHRGRS